MINRQLNNLIDDRAGDEYLMSLIDLAKLPAHVAIIMDGNGRWANRRSLPRIAGHRAGAASVRATVETAARLGLGYLTLYAFSTENWKRPRLEVDALMKLLKEFLNKELAALQRNKIRFQMIGREQGLDPRLLEEIKSAEHETSKNTGLRLSIAINYGGRAELTDAVRQLAWEAAAGRLNPDRIDEALISTRLYTDSLPDPDLLIRTSGEMRISNFLIWQIAYSELYVTEKLWPDFRGRDLLAAILDYQQRERRYGSIRTAHNNR
ncbi:MAG TPA: isoprenyl transferase [Blastocatellia bacterium]|nr:isoprenyl transferase [Blastocatellia bacterium]